jgi:mycothiol synthase
VTDLPHGWSIRRPTMDDVPAILAVIHASDIAAIGEPDFTTDEVVEVLQAPNHDLRRDSWLAVDDTGRVVGWAFIENPTGGQREHFDAYVDPEHGRPAHAALVDLVLARVPERARAFGHDWVTLRGGVIAQETEYVEILRRAGFAFVKRYARMRGQLTGSEQPPDVPDGITIRPLRHTDEAELRAFHEVLDTAFQDTPDHQPSDFETFQRRLEALPDIEWDEWFVAEVDSAVVGILQSAPGGELDEGWVKNLAVAKAFRGRGIGNLLLRKAFATYAAKGRRAVGLGVDMTNPTGAYRLYDSVGLSPAYEADVYERRVDAAQA